MLVDQGFVVCGQVNDQDVTSCTHQQCVSALVNSPQTVVLRVRHDPPPPNMKVSYRHTDCHSPHTWITHRHTDAAHEGQVQLYTSHTYTQTDMLHMLLKVAPHRQDTVKRSRRRTGI